MLPGDPLRRAVVLVLATASLLAAPARAPGQLRPLEPSDWQAFEPGSVVRGQLGGGVLFRQRASIAGMSGRLLEAPAAFLSWTTGRVALSAVIHPLRVLRVDSTFSSPLPGTTDLDPRRQMDAGDNALETFVRLTEPGAPAAAGVRYGVRLSTHNDRKGLDRHKTDFYGLVAGRLAARGWSLQAEAGVGVYGTRAPGAETATPVLYSAGVRRRFGVLEPVASITGQASGRRLRGNEDLSELRLGVRAGRARWLEATIVRGLTDVSPRAGVLLFAGVSLPGR